MHGLEAKWKEITSRARLDNEFDRTVALVTAVGSLEVGLTAVGIARNNREGVAARLNRLTSQTSLPGIPSEQKIKAALTARNLATHTHDVPSKEDTIEYIGVLYKVWRCLRRYFVTKDNAIKISRELYRNTWVSSVYLFGSLSRGASDPNDIDILVFDTGDYSYYTFDYEWSELLGEEVVFDSNSFNSAIKCGWLQLVFLDAAQFGVDSTYTLSIVNQQKDPLFFLNLADGLKKYDPDHGVWLEDTPPVFEGFLDIREQLEAKHLLAPQ